VGLVHDYEVEGVGRLQPFLELLVAAEHIETGDEQRVLLEGIAGTVSAQVIAGEDDEGEVELVIS
jgi:hypothetical protein